MLGLSVCSGYILISLKSLCSLFPGLQTSEDAKLYALSPRLKPFSNENETLVVQFSVKHKQNVDCGGKYVKFFPDTLNQEDICSESEYYIMFSKLSDNSCYQTHEVLVRATTGVKKAQVDLEQEISNGIAPCSYVVGLFKDLRKSNSKPKCYYK